MLTRYNESNESLINENSVFINFELLNLKTLLFDIED